MKRLVMKFGGTASADAARLETCAALIARRRHDGAALAVLVSAAAGQTDALAAMAAEADPQGQWPDEADAVLAAGEQINAALLAMALRRRGLKARSFGGWQAGILTDGRHGAARIESLDAQRLGALIDGGTIAVIAGFQGLGPDGRITTLGRGGSDLSAVALAAALKAEACEICTDVAGIMSADPAVAPKAGLIERLSYEEMLEMASQGAKVMQSRAVALAMAERVALRIRSGFHGPGDQERQTWVNQTAGLESARVRAISYSRDEARILVRAMPSGPDALRDIFAAFSAAGIEVDLIVQSPSAQKHKSTLVFSLRRGDAAKALDLLSDPCHNPGLETVQLDEDMAKVSVIGIGLRAQTKMAHTMFEALAARNIAIGAVATSETRISALIANTDVELAVRTLHSAFGLDRD